jgi:hypothetical protein
MRRPHEERGTAAIEFALVLPLLLTVTLALVEVGLLARDRLLVEAEESATRSDAIAAAPGLDPADLTVSVLRSGSRGDPVTVTIGYIDTVRVPFIGWLMGTSVSMETEASARQEFG